MTLTNPDCRDGKHRACTGEGWGDDADTVVGCSCGCHAYCDRDSCWLEPGHDGECKSGGYVHGTKGAAQVNERTLLVIPTAEGRRTELSSVSDEQYEAVRERLRELCGHEPSM